MFWAKRLRRQTVLELDDCPRYRVFEQADFVRADNILDLNHQNEDWRDGMKKVGEHLTLNHVDQVVFMHGTFVGDDPTGLLGYLEMKLPEHSIKLVKKIKKFAKSSTDLFIGDHGNFTSEYLDIFASASSYPRSSMSSFSWSSANHHVARLKGSIDYLRHLYELELNRQKQVVRILSVGHSHAYQVYALVTHLLNKKSKLHKGLVSICVAYDFLTIAELKKIALSLKGINLDFVTLGSPVVYPWALKNNDQALHLINHRGSMTKEIGIASILKTTHGDYVQLLGSAGSDFGAFDGLDREINSELDEILGVKTNIGQYVRRSISQKRLISQYGKSLLIDYRDHSSWMPNLLQTAFGHGVYTHYPHMLFNFKLICNYLYHSEFEVPKG